MNRPIFTAAIIAITLVPAAAAQSDLYVNGGTSVYDASDATVTAVTLRGGFDFHDLLGAEFEVSFGLGAEELNSGVEIELENQFGGYLVGRYPVAPRLDVLGRVGFTTGEYQSSNNGVSGDVDAGGFAFGIGGEYMLTQQFGLRGDFTRVQTDDDELDGGVNVFAVTGVYKFGSVR